MRVLVVNAGSSSLKLRLLGDGDELVAERDLEAGAPIGELGEMGRADVVGHRVVHGGSRFSQAVLVDDEVAGALRELTALAPLHQPAALDALGVVGEALPDVPSVACFDTAFHATLPPAAATYPLPRAWRERHPLRRFGFHGLSHAYASRRAAGMLGRSDPDLRVVTCHLGAGASLAAVRGGRCVETTMGFTPLEGLCMATRSGSVDPGLILWLQRHGGLSVEELEHGLERESGLRGLAGDGDMRAVLAAAADGAPDARLALDVYLHRLRAAIAAMAAALGGLDALVFTGGVGEHAPEVRVAAAAGLGFLGVAVDEDPRAPVAPDAEITAPGAAARTLVVTAREDLEIARQVRALLAGDPTNAEAS